MSPHTDEVGIGAGEEVATSPYSSEVGSELALEVDATTDVDEQEEEEDENHDTHFKCKRRSPFPVVSPVASP